MARRDARGIVRGAALLAAAAGALYFAVEGGEYGTSDLLRQRRDAARIQRSIDSLSHLVDTLRAYRDRVETDAAIQERIAREEFGMVRGSKELLYRFTEPSPPRDTVRRRR